MLLIPAIDLIDGKCVRLTQGDYAQKTVYNEDPLEVAQSFEAAGATRLHLVDLDGAKAKHIVNHKVLERIASKTSLQIDFGGGLGSSEDLRIAFENGAKQVTGGSIAVRDPKTFLGWIEQFGPEKIILGADAKDGRIAISGWQEDSGQELLDFVDRYEKEGVRYVISTDVSKDGMLLGPSFEMYQELQDRFAELNIIASGGVRDLADLELLSEQGLYGAIVGKAIYEGRITLKDIEAYHAH